MMHGPINLGNGNVFQCSMSILRILRVWLFLLPDRGLAVQVAPESGDSTVIYSYCTVLRNSFVFIVLKHLRCFKLEFDGMVCVTKTVLFQVFSKLQINEFCF